MNNLLSIKYSDINEYPVSGRELHERLGIGTAYTVWFGRMCDYGFEAGKDFETDSKNVIRADGAIMPQSQEDHNMTLSMAKEICMLQRTDKGREVRRYLIKLEVAWNTPELLMARALQSADSTIKKLNGSVAELSTKIEQDKPFTEFGKAVETSRGSLLVREFAKVASNSPEITIGQNQLFDWLREKKYLMWNNEPYQDYINNGWFEVREHVINTAAGSQKRLTTMITGKGQVALMKALRRDFASRPGQTSFLGLAQSQGKEGADTWNMPN